MLKYHAPAGFNNRNLLSDPGGRKLKMKVLARPAPLRPLCLSCALTVFSCELALYIGVP